MSSTEARAITIDRGDNARQLVILSLASLCPILRSHAVTTATIEYDGSGDEGQVNEIALHMSSRSLWPCRRRDVPPTI